MDRRTLLKSGSTALLGLGLGGCAMDRAGREVSTAADVRHSLLRLPLVEASWDRVIRTTVGLRPHRDPGFMLRAGKLDEKLLIHNYGHGGAGVTVSWGCAYRVADLVQDGCARVAAVAR